MSTNKSTVTIECRNCGCKHCPVTNTDHREIIYRGKTIQHIKRYRRCRYCGLSFTTIETYESESAPDFPAVHPNAGDDDLTGFSAFIKPNKNQPRPMTELPPDLLPKIAAKREPPKSGQGQVPVPPKKRRRPGKGGK